MTVYDYTYNSCRKNKFRFIFIDNDSYTYYKKLSIKMIIKYLNMKWKYDVDILDFIRDIKDLDLVTPEIELAIKLR